jgi:hypothetical protein
LFARLAMILLLIRGVDKEFPRCRRHTLCSLDSYSRQHHLKLKIKRGSEDRRDTWVDEERFEQRRYKMLEQRNKRRAQIECQSLRPSLGQLQCQSSLHPFSTNLWLARISTNGSLALQDRPSISSRGASHHGSQPMPLSLYSLRSCYFHHQVIDMRVGRILVGCMRGDA